MWMRNTSEAIRLQQRLFGPRFLAVETSCVKLALRRCRDDHSFGQDRACGPGCGRGGAGPPVVFARLCLACGREHFIQAYGIGLPRFASAEWGVLRDMAKWVYRVCSFQPRRCTSVY